MNATVVLQSIKQAILASQFELMIFFFAIVSHKMLFGKYRVERTGTKASCKSSAPVKSTNKDEERSKFYVDKLNQHMASIRSAAAAGNLNEAMKVFRSCSTKPVALYNAAMDACIVCNRSDMAEQIMTEAVSARSVDVATYNTLMKARLRKGDVVGARLALSEMRKAGITPTCVTFNELLDATVYDNAETSWQIVDEMRAARVTPNRITCSIMLKSVQPKSSSIHLEKAMLLMNSLEEGTDEILFSSIIEACIRVNRIDLLKSTLQRQRSDQKVELHSSHAYGSLIRAYGVTNNLTGVWATWRQLKTERVPLTSVTLGCMVEAVVMNEDAESGYEIIREALTDPETRPLVNAIIYGSVIKGFSHQKKFDRVWNVYKEMVQEGVTLSIATYNTIMDACARCGEMSRVPEILMGMSANRVELNIITYSAIIKGYCQENRIDNALELMKEMKANTALQPDEYIYNTMINGCARQGMYDKGVAMLEDMCQAGIKPSNFTLSVLVKLASRSRRLDKAFDLCNDLSRKFNFKLNVHVYNNLIQACIQHKGSRHAFEVIETMVAQRVRLDVRTYTLMLPASVDSREVEDAVGLIRAAAGLPVTHPQLTGGPASLFQPHGGLPSQLLNSTLESLVTRCGESVLAGQLQRDLSRLSGYKLDAKLMQRITNMSGQ